MIILNETILGIIGILINTILILYGWYIAFKTLKIEKYKYLITGFMIFSFYNFCMASFINSGYAARPVFITYWLLQGLIISIFKVYKKRNKEINNISSYSEHTVQ